MTGLFTDTLVWLHGQRGPEGPPAVAVVRARLRIPPDAVYRVWPRGFGARLTPAQAAALRVDSDVFDVQDDGPGHPAPYRRTESPARVEGSYFVMLEAGSDPAATASRLGVEPTGLYRISFTGFAATMTDQQLDHVRRDRDVTWIVDDGLAGS